MNKRANIRHWNSSHNDWLRALDFYKEEIVILSARLTEVAGKNTSREIAAQVEHFQNGFILHRNNIEELAHKIRSSLDKVSKEILQHEGFVSSELLTQLEKERDAFYEQEKDINELRHNFNQFCAEWM